MSGPSGPAALVSSLRKLAVVSRSGGPARPAADGVERCDFCRTTLPAEHRHLLDVEERRILCSCETCVIKRADDPRYRPPGRRCLRLTSFHLPEEIWARFKIPVGLAFFLWSSVAQQVIALYPSPLGAIESELDLEAWEELRRENLMLASLEADAEALLVRRNTQDPEYYVVPTDDCYRLVGLLKSAWKGIGGGPAAEAAIEGYFGELRQRAREA